MTSNKERKMPRTLILLISTLTSASANLNVANIACSDDYNMNLQSVSFACDDCTFGASSKVSSSLSYFNASSLNLYVDYRYKFEAWANDTFKQLVGGSNVVDKLKVTEYMSLCDGDDCSTAGYFDLSHSYTIPSTGNMDAFFEGFNVSARLLFYSADAGNIVGDCEVMYTTKSLYTKKAYYDDNTADEVYYVEGSNDGATVYEYVASQSSWYMKSFIYATAAFLGVYAGTQIYAKSGLCRTIELEEDNRREQLMSRSISMSCNSDDVERLQQDIQSRIHIFKEKIPWPQVDSVKLVHEESIPWPEDSVCDSYTAPSAGRVRSSSPKKGKCPKKSPAKTQSPPKQTTPKKKEVVDIIQESKSSQSEVSSKASARDIESDGSKSVSSSKSGSSMIKKLFKKK